MDKKNKVNNVFVNYNIDQLTNNSTPGSTENDSVHANNFVDPRSLNIHPLLYGFIPKENDYIDSIRQSIAEQGYKKQFPILIGRIKKSFNSIDSDRNDFLVDGHIRLQCAKDINCKVTVEYSDFDSVSDALMFLDDQQKCFSNTLDLFAGFRKYKS